MTFYTRQFKGNLEYQFGAFVRKVHYNGRYYIVVARPWGTEMRTRAW